MVKKQYAAVDIAKYVSALLVVCIHTFPFIDINEMLNTYFIQTICRLAVPFFFMISGYFLFRKIRNEEEDKDVLKKYLFRLLKIYLIWTVIYLPYTIYNYVQAQSGWMGIFSYLRDFLLNGSYYHLWFLPALMTGTLIVYYLYHKKGMLFTLKIALLLYGIGYLLNIYAPLWEQIPFISFLFSFFTKTMTTARNGFFFAPIFIGIGMLLAKTRRIPCRVAQLAFVISFALLVIEVTLYILTGMMHDLACMYLSLIPATFFLGNCLLTSKIAYKPSYRSLREDSLLIYTVHILFAQPLLSLLPNAHIVVYFLTIACSQIFATLVIRYKERVPLLEHLV
ncbi:MULTISPECIES: acyltransferase [Faecalicoccus]|uniref:Acyltransferase n=1 Tax=Faecalicoccus pleomorphus TaxID=1323 RepID=A0A7X9NIX0_9FIRM|nr:MULTISPECIES: acyltransferase [Faecalicoccus]MBM6678615.1 acyltransferase [Faecalicoccus pleomorphus]MBM6765636.1 acyltransferase [Faecalicoccus pleomorphus]MDB7987238.1 acyltransferase [Faecalicoccus pleomorphus]MDB7991094.1 acyltransferase [Faecalicoccus pleomorphus]MDM8291947.1 acyltransferase [Faecalicoccus pleomorphus]